MSGIHPIEVESYRILRARVDLTAWPPTSRAVVERMIHASADLDYAATTRLSEEAARAGVAALAAGAGVPVLAVVGRVLDGVPLPEGVEVVSLVDAVGEERALTDTAAAVEEVVTARLRAAG